MGKRHRKSFSTLEAVLGIPDLVRIWQGDEAMTARKIAFPPGSIFYVDPNADFSTGDYVGAYIAAENRYVVRRYHGKRANGALETALRPLNRRIPAIILVEGDRIIGRALGAMVKL